MEKIDLNQVRGFSDSITVTFNFIKQEFKPLLRSLALLVLPWIFIDLLIKVFVVGDMVTHSMTPGFPVGGRIIEVLGSYLLALLVMYWLLLFVISYIRVYMDHFHQEPEFTVTSREVWQVMLTFFGKLAGESLLFLFIVTLGFMFLFVPGIYFAVAFIFAPFFIVFREKSVSASLGASMDLVRGRWWNLFGYLIVLQLILGALSYVFTIPYLVVIFKSAFTQEAPNGYELSLGLMFSTLGQYLLQIISIVGIAVRFFSFLEKDEHTGLLSKIEQLGSSTQQAE